MLINKELSTSTLTVTRWIGQVSEASQLENDGFCYHHRFQHHASFTALYVLGYHLYFFNFGGPLYREPIVVSFSNLRLLIADPPLPWWALTATSRARVPKYPPPPNEEIFLREKKRKMGKWMFRTRDQVFLDKKVTQITITTSQDTIRYTPWDLLQIKVYTLYSLLIVSREKLL
jgi:hypothetical protein